MAIAAGVAVAAVAATASVASAKLGADAQKAGVKRAGNVQERIANAQLEFAQQQYRESQPFRQIAEQYARAGVDVLPLIRNQIDNPTMSEGYKLAGREGLDLIQKNFATTGSPESGPAQIAAGRFVAGLTAAERDRQTENLFRLAGFGTNAGSTANVAAGIASAGYGQAGQSYANLAGLQVQGGAVQAGLYGNVGNAISSIGGQVAGGLIGSAYAKPPPTLPATQLV